MNNKPIDLKQFEGLSFDGIRLKVHMQSNAPALVAEVKALREALNGLLTYMQTRLIIPDNDAWGQSCKERALALLPKE